MSKHQTCSICFQNTTHWQHSWKFYVCNVCIQIWVVTRITTDQLTGQEPIPCLQPKCNDYIFFSEMQEWLSSEQMDKVCKAYNDNYISSTMDIVRCPRSGCSFAGIMSKNTWKRPFSCPAWEYEWRDHAQLSRSELAVKSLANVMELNPESFNYINKLLYSHACPSCHMTISKTEGWNHMMCRQCQYEFCWECLAHYPGYVHDPHAICCLRKNIFRVLLLIPILLWMLYLYAKL